ncbi:MAG: SRPBCC domain-containing protein [Pseudomonadota bacterium]
MIPPVEKTVHVPLSPEHAFELFTSRMGEWWPMETHSISSDTEASDPAQGLRFETGADGKITETLADGTESVWAHVTDWDAPNTFSIDWYPGEEPDLATQVKVTFTADTKGTRVDLVHSGFDVRGKDPEKMRAAYNEGWVGVMDRFIAATPVIA